MLNDEDKKLYEVIFKAEDTVHSGAGGLWNKTASYCAIKKIYIVVPGGQMKWHEHFKTVVSQLLRAQPDCIHGHAV